MGPSSSTPTGQYGKAIYDERASHRRHSGEDRRGDDNSEPGFDIVGPDLNLDDDCLSPHEYSGPARRSCDDARMTGNVNGKQRAIWRAARSHARNGCEKSRCRSEQRHSGVIGEEVAGDDRAPGGQQGSGVHRASPHLTPRPQMWCDECGQDAERESVNEPPGVKRSLEPVPVDGAQRAPRGAPDHQYAKKHEASSMPSCEQREHDAASEPHLHECTDDPQAGKAVRCCDRVVHDPQIPVRTHDRAEQDGLRNCAGTGSAVRGTEDQYRACYHRNEQTGHDDWTEHRARHRIHALPTYIQESNRTRVPGTHREHGRADSPAGEEDVDRLEPPESSEVPQTPDLRQDDESRADAEEHHHQR
ncbi:hypothetical protein SAMN04489844_3500 [Nocardioides exalbidus]|uniref:Uncharacterized protein n=1 Tax=Nocardioides exalbidus TaxID=402596 RepID=A0A1H4XB91_9ACTN|nr:hypothetical protein SAMN04489844_3500 [Nocardioides exalbidus]